MRKDTNFKLGSALRCHLGQENAIFVGKGYAFYKFAKRCDLGAKINPVSTMFAHSLLPQTLGCSKSQQFFCVVLMQHTQVAEVRGYM